MKKVYDQVEINVILIEQKDIITTSGEDETIIIQD